MVQRRLPRPSELRPLLRPAPFVWNADERRLRREASIADLRMIARRRTPRAVFDYVDGAADGELSLHRARRAFARVEFTPTVLRDVSETDTSREILGRRSNLPFAFAPTGFTRMMHHTGERAVASVAQQAGIPYTLSTMGTTTIEDVAEAAPQARRWFQLYLWRDRAPAKDLVQRAAEAGYDTLMLTVDTPVGGARLRDVRNGLTIPPALSLRTFLDGARHPHWWFNLLTTEPLTFSSLENAYGSVEEMINRVFDPALTMDDVAPEPMPCSCPTTVAASSTAPRSRSSWSSPPFRPSVTAPRCSSTPASPTAPTSSPPSRSAPAPPSSDAPTSTG